VNRGVLLSQPKIHPLPLFALILDQTPSVFRRTPLGLPLRPGDKFFHVFCPFSPLSFLGGGGLHKKTSPRPFCCPQGFQLCHTCRVMNQQEQWCETSVPQKTKMLGNIIYKTTQDACQPTNIVDCFKVLSAGSAIGVFFPEIRRLRRPISNQTSPIGIRFQIGHVHPAPVETSDPKSDVSHKETSDLKSQINVRTLKSDFKNRRRPILKKVEKKGEKKRAYYNPWELWTDP